MSDIGKGFLHMKIMTVIGIVIIIIGIYMIFASLKMKTSGKIQGILLADEERNHCSNESAFITYIYWREMLVGIAMIILGVSEIAKDWMKKTGLFTYIGIVIGMLALLWFFYSLKKARELYIQN